MNDDDLDDANDIGEVEGFSDAEIDESLKPFFEEVDADYEAMLEPIAKVFEAKGPPRSPTPSIGARVHHDDGVTPP